MRAGLRQNRAAMALKRCPHCAEEIQAEEIQEEATLCRHCGRPVPTQAGPFQPRGNRYVIALTRTGDGYGIWDLTTGGGPIATYPVGETGWNQCWAQFKSWEQRPLHSGRGTGSALIPSAALVLIGGGLILLGSFLPWVTASAPFVGTVSRSGMDGGGDGVVTLILGAITLLIGIARITRSDLPRYVQRSAIVTGVIAAVVVGIDYSTLEDRIRAATQATNLISASIGVGVWTVFVGAAFAVAGGLSLRGLSH
jgi:hypothetical protein